MSDTWRKFQRDKAYPDAKSLKKLLGKVDPVKIELPKPRKRKDE